jgi:phosphohistidine phosphatase
MGMELFIIRHGIAVPGSMLLADADRPLTPKGRKRFSQAVRGLQRLKVRFDRLYHSPWLRAVETAELLAPVLDGKAVDSAALARAPSQDLLDALMGERVALVGHEPWMGELVAWLTTGAPPHGHVFAFKRGGVAWLEGQPQPGQMVLQAFLPPKMLRKLGDGVSR